MSKKRAVRLRSVVVAGLVALGLIVVPSAPAMAADWTMVDGLENNPSGTWTFAGQGAAGGSFNAFTGVNFSTGGYLSVGDNSSWASFGRSVYIPPRGINQSTWCQLSFSVKRSLTPNNFANIRLEVIRPSDWTYLKYRDFTVINGDWGTYTTGVWADGPSTVFVRMAVSASASNGVDINFDNMSVSCDIL